MDEQKKAWYDTPENREYEEAVNSVKEAVEGGMPFDEAAAKISLKDQSLREAAVSDALKVLIAEMHFTRKLPLTEVSEKLRLPLERVEAAKREMIQEVEAAAIEKYKQSMGQEGNA
jgi:hypothetical protein